MVIISDVLNFRYFIYLFFFSEVSSSDVTPTFPGNLMVYVARVLPFETGTG